MRFKHLFLIAFLLVVSLILGCSNGETPVAPASGDQPVDVGRDYNAISPYPGGNNLGNFKFLLDEEAGTAELIQAERAGQKDVTAWATITIEGYHFDAVHRNWEIDARITNTTPYTGWGVLAVFTELGEKSLVGQDGYLYIPDPSGDPKRCPVIAYSKHTEQRIFPPTHTDVRKIIIHIPPDVPALYPVEFFIDAWWPGPRQEPYVEDLVLEPLADPGSYHIGAHIRDWQTLYSHQLEVKGIIPIDGGDPFVFELFDDGNHGDGSVNDHLWGANFNFPYPAGKYFLIVKAWDLEDNTFENDICFHHESGPPPCEPIPWWKIDEGIHGNIEQADEWVFYNDPPFAEWWEWLKGPDIPPPPIFWQCHQVFGITLGVRPTSGFWIRIDEVCIDNEEDVIHVEYTEMIPGEGCVVMEVLTTPYIVVGMTRYEDVPVEFHANEEIYDCPEPECVEFGTLDEGSHSGYHDPVMQLINCPVAFGQFWETHNPDEPVPQINFEHYSVVAVVAGDKPTTGYFVEIDWICKESNADDAPWVVHFTLHIPADNCPVEEIITQPFQIVVSEKITGCVKWEDAHVVYDCPDEKCLNFGTLYQGQFSGHSSVVTRFNSYDTFEPFWHVHKPGTPVPEVNFEHYSVVAAISGSKPTTAYKLEIDWICKEPPFEQNPWVIHLTQYTPADNCPVYEIPTSPYHIIITQKFDGPYEVEDAHEIYDCPEENCLGFGLLAEGNHSGWHEQNIKVIDNQDEWGAFWYTHTQSEPLPPVGWDNHVVIVFAMGDYPTTGYWPEMLKVCWNDNEDAWVIDWAFFIPGGSVDVAQVVTQPFAYYILQRPLELPIFVFNGEEIVYEQQG